VSSWTSQRPRAASGGERYSAQLRQGGAELILPGPALGQMKGEAACLAGEPSGQGEETSPEGLGGDHLLAQTDARCPVSQVMGHDLYSPAALAGKCPEGRWLSPTPYLRPRMAFSISVWYRGLLRRNVRHYSLEGFWL